MGSGKSRQGAPVLELPCEVLILIYCWLPTLDLVCFVTSCKLLYYGRRGRPPYLSPLEEALRRRAAALGHYIPHTLPAGQLHWVPYLLHRAWLRAHERRLQRVALGAWHALFVNDAGQVLSCGYEKRDEPTDEMLGSLGIGSIGDATRRELTRPSVLPTISHIAMRSVAARDMRSYAITTDGELYAWGTLSSVCLQQPQPAFTPARVNALHGHRVRMIAPGSATSVSAAVTEDGYIYVWGGGRTDVYGDADVEIPPTRLESLHAHPLVGIEALAGMRISSVAVSERAIFAVSEMGDLYTWGAGQHGTLGHGDRVDRARATRVESLRDVRVHTVAAHERHVLAMSEDGDLFSWGCGAKTQSDGRGPPWPIGLGHPLSCETHRATGGAQLEPERVEAMRGMPVICVAVGHSHSCAVTRSGYLFTWGGNTFGQLGHGPAPHQLLPRLVEALQDTKMVAVVAGKRHTLAIAADGVVYGWGSGRRDEPVLGLNLRWDRLVPLAYNTDEVRVFAKLDEDTTALTSISSPGASSSRVRPFELLGAA